MKQITLALSVFIILCYNLHSNPVINEFMPAPINNEPEWIELFNSSNDSLSIYNNYICDDQSKKEINTKCTIPPKSYCILTKDSSKLKNIRNIPSETIIIQMALPTLNNTNDQIILLNNECKTIDSLCYDMKNGKRESVSKGNIRENRQMIHII